MTKYADTLKKVKEILDDKEHFDSIMKKYKKKKESKEKYVVNRKARILQIPKEDDVSEDDYVVTRIASDKPSSDCWEPVVWSL